MICQLLIRGGLIFYASPGFNFNSGFHSFRVGIQIDKIYKKLEQTFENPTSGDINCALEALKLISCLPEHAPPSKSQNLFLVIMESLVTEDQSQAKWEASCLTMQSACKGDGFKDAQHILTFLNHHFELVTRHGQSQDEPIQNALCALNQTSDTVIIEALKQFDPTMPSFVHGISYVFQGNRSPRLCEAALLFLPLICDRWFNTRSPVMDSTAMSKFFIGWASTIDCLMQTSEIQKAALIVFLEMVNSPYWRPHITPEKWTLLEHFKLVPSDLQSLQGCINNVDLMDEVKNVDNPRAIVLWVEILWSKYMELIPEVQKQLKMVTEEIAQNEKDICLSASQSYIYRYLSNANLELREAEDALKQYTGQPDDWEAIALEEWIGKLQQVFWILDTIRLGRTS